MSRARELRDQLIVHGTFNGFKAENVTEIGRGIPATAKEVTDAMIRAHLATGPEGEMFVSLDPQVVDELVAIANTGTYSAASKERHIRRLLGALLYPQVIHTDGQGDTILTVTDGDRGML